MIPPPKQSKCGCGKPSVMCVHGADTAVWVCRVCFARLVKIVAPIGTPS